MFPTPWLCLLPAFLSGFCALGLEMLWIQRIEYRFGNTAEAGGIVIAIFFLCAAAGNGLGGWLAKRAGSVDALFRRWVVTSMLTGAVALGCWHASDWTVELPTLLGALWLAGPASVLLGVGFPLLGGIVATGGDAITSRAGLVYAAEFTGATLAIGVAGIWWPVVWDYPTTALMLTGLLLVCPPLILGVAAGRLRGGHGNAAQPHELRSAPAAAIPAWGVAVASGFLVLAFEMVAIDWMRHLSGFSIQASALVLAICLGGLGTGAAVAGMLRRRGYRAETLLAVSLVGGGFLIGVVAGVVQMLIRANEGEAWQAVGLPGALILSTAVVAGMPFPLAWDLARRNAAPGWTLGRLTACNKIAAAAGALAAIFFFIPWLGIQSSAFLIGLGYVVCGAWFLPRMWRPVAAGVGMLLVAGLLQPWHPMHVGRDDELLDVTYGPYGSVAVVESERPSRRIVMDNRYTLNGTSEALLTQRNQSWIPLTLTVAEAPRVLMLGMGSGISAEAALDFPVASLEVIELVPEVVDAAREWFGPWNARLFEDPRVTLRVADGRHFLAAAPDEERWDLIVCDLFLPARTGARYFYTRTFFEQARRHLTEEGVFCLWIPAYQWEGAWMQSLIAGFREVFPGGVMVRGNLDPLQPVLGLISAPGRVWETRLDRQATPPAVVRSGEFFFRTPEHFALSYVAPVSAARLKTTGRPIEEDSLWFTWQAGIERESTMLRGNRLLHWLTETFGTDRSDAVLARASRAANHWFAAAVQSIPIPGGENAIREARARQHRAQALKLYPETGP